MQVFQTKKTIMLSALILAIAVSTSIFAVIQVSVALPASKHAVAGEDTLVIRYMGDIEKPFPQIYTDIPVLSTRIKTSEQKDLVISFTTECVLVTDTKIKGGSKSLDLEYDEAMDRATIKVWVTVTPWDEGPPEDKAFPGEVCFAERIQTLKGLLGWVTYEVDLETGEVTGVIPEELELLLETTSANGFNFLALNVGSGEHVITVWATIELDEVGEWKEEEMERVAAAIGKRTLVVHEVRLIKEASPYGV